MKRSEFIKTAGLGVGGFVFGVGLNLGMLFAKKEEFKGLFAGEPLTPRATVGGSFTHDDFKDMLNTLKEQDRKVNNSWYALTNEEGMRDFDKAMKGHIQEYPPKLKDAFI